MYARGTQQPGFWVRTAHTSLSAQPARGLLFRLLHIPNNPADTARLNRIILPIYQHTRDPMFRCHQSTHGANSQHPAMFPHRPRVGAVVIQRHGLSSRYCGRECCGGCPRCGRSIRQPAIEFSQPRIAKQSSIRLNYSEGDDGNGNGSPMAGLLRPVVQGHIG